MGEMNYKVNRVIRYVTYVIELIILFMLQETPGILPPIFGVRPLLTLALAVTVSLIEPELFSMGFGVLVGITMDLGVGLPLGTCGVILAIACSGISALAKRKIHVTLGSAIITAVWCLAVLMAVLWLCDYVFMGYSQIYIALINHYVPVYVYTILVMPLVYILNLGIFSALRA